MRDLSGAPHTETDFHFAKCKHFQTGAVAKEQAVTLSKGLIISSKGVLSLL
jgi:hypothetical protein